MGMESAKLWVVVLAGVVEVTIANGSAYSSPLVTVHGRVEEVRYCESDGVVLADTDLQLIVTNSDVDTILIDKSGFRPLAWKVAHSEDEALEGKWVSGVELHHVEPDPVTRRLHERDLLVIAPGREVTLGSRSVMIQVQLSESGEKRLPPGVYSLVVEFAASTLSDERLVEARQQFESRGRLLSDVVRSGLITVELESALDLAPCDSVERERGPDRLRVVDGAAGDERP